MTDRFDLVIRRGAIVDGTGRTPFDGDVAIEGGRIVAVAPAIPGKGREEIDAKGCLVTPGFVDIHTHYDGQATWENRLSPSSSHGVTTAVMGNCGIGFAPCRPEDHGRLIRLMEGVEDLPEPVLAAGLPWNWESFPDYLDALAARRYDIDIAAQLPHSALRVYAMGQRAVDREAATSADLAQMARVAREAVAAGAIGFSTSRTINHRASDGSPIPTLTAAENELTTIALALAAAGSGVLQVISDFPDPESDFAMLRRIVEASRRPLSISLMQLHSAPDKWRTILDSIEQANRDGLPISAQVCGRPVGMLLGFELSYNPFSFCPSYKVLAGLSVSDRLKALGNPEIRARIIGEDPGPSDFPGAARLRDFSNMFALGDPPDYEPAADAMIDADAAKRGIRPEELAYDRILERGASGVLFSPAVNFADGTLEPSLEMMRDRNTVLGLGDGGAHLGFLCDASLPTFMLSYWARDRVRGDRLSLPEVVEGLTRSTARAVRLLDRGVIAPGYRADANIIDFDKLALRAPRVVYDLPAGGRRLTQQAQGYVATIVNGRIVYREGVASGELPGRLVRGPQVVRTSSG